MDEGKVFHASDGRVHVLRFVGEIRYPLAPSVERFIDGLFAEGAPIDFVMDLTEAKVIDSTNLGLLARVAQRMQPRLVTLVSNREDINRVLESMGFDEVFAIVPDSESTPEACGELATPAPDQQSLRDTVLEAHRSLMALNKRNQALFRDVVVALEQSEKNQRPGA